MRRYKFQGGCVVRSGSIYFDMDVFSRSKGFERFGRIQEFTWPRD